MSDLLSEALQLNSNGFAPSAIKAPQILPDIAQDSIAHIGGTLERVGMSGVESVLTINEPGGKTLTLPTQLNAFVSLDDDKAKGIHMSRLFLSLQDHLDEATWSPSLAGDVLSDFIRKHAEISFSAYLSATFQLPIRRQSLLSGNQGWRHYPVRTESIFEGGRCRHWLTVGLTYSSTCPCSAALSRQLVQQAFANRFDGQHSVDMEEAIAWLGTQAAIAGQPHSQRSHADVTVEIESEQFPIVELIDRMEAVLKTPVQTAVKRIDEQEFARLNAEQLMFCEDSARILAADLREYDMAKDFRVRVEHLESLHAHDAVAVVTKGLPEGLKP
ncbi:GTP cyclohydrolase FolE2 [Calycomorphotria hydatis]|uniref:GTP cyclohydrolase FolE2 n=1 Tax=Calycomorphotria hydatis TaxID=2528027 RepID=A0A517T8Y4_9PLAN|nr:GTP cyclohydrolase FolE2 [Calycomorphotria hydatis]QDT64842.1 GTP cyclohydrolase FolE2 [Calycomorphotria hydatis]